MEVPSYGWAKMIFLEKTSVSDKFEEDSDMYSRLVVVIMLVPSISNRR